MRWRTADEFIIPGYTGTVQTATTTHAGDDAADPVSAGTAFTFDHRGRQSGATVDPDGVATGEVKTKTEYAYEDSGIRIRQTTVKIEADSDDEVPGSETTTEYVISHGNHTGNAQTIEEWVDDGLGAEQTRSFTIGHDVIAEASTAITQAYQAFLYDGHGSVRQLTDEVATIIKAAYETIAEVNEVSKLDYDAYGEAINFAASTAVSALLYSGEYLDTVTQQQYLRARFYDSSTGRFNRVDAFAGAFLEPQSLNKYLYAHADPVAHSDPSGYSPLLFVFLPIVFGAIAALDTALGGGTTGDVFSSFFDGFRAGLLFGLIAPLLLTPVGFSVGLGVGLAAGSLALNQSVEDGNTTQAWFRGGLLALPFAVGSIRLLNAARPSAQVSQSTSTAARVVANIARMRQSSSLLRTDAWGPRVLSRKSLVVQARPGGSEFFTTSEAATAAIGRGGYYGGLQIPAHATLGTRTHITVFETTRDIPIAVSIARANAAHGPGGMPQMFVHKQYHQYLRPIKTYPLSP